MEKKRILIIGAGKRVQTAALPAIEKLGGLYEAHKIYSRTEKTFSAGGATYTTSTFDTLSNDDMSIVDLVYIAVTKDQTPNVLKKLNDFDISKIDLLIETPVLLFKHYHYVSLLEKYRNVWASEDCIDLPCFDLLTNSPELIGPVKEVEFFQSAYKYHSIATMKRLLECATISRASRKKISHDLVCRTFKFANGRIGRVMEPRDYSKGKFIIFGEQDSLADYKHEGNSSWMITPIKEAPLWSGFRAKSTETHLCEDEKALMGDSDFDLSITSRMEDMKKVGFFRMLKKIHDGEGGYPVVEAIDDMIIDYYLDRIGFYINSPLMSIKSSVGRLLLRSFTRLVSK